MPDRYLGRQIGKYRVIRLLGAGAFAWVYEAVDRDLEIPVALKILRPEFAGQNDAEARFRREAATAARLRHPNIVTVRDVGQIDGASFVAMDLLPLSLARRLELLTRLPESDVVRIGLDVAAALSVAHAGGIVHRDIKPDNILIGTVGEAVVADFGLARALDGGAMLSGSNQVMGTPHYFSPEQARGLELDGRSDLYALGVTLFRSATGRLPFEGDDWYVVSRMHVESAPPSPQEFVPDLTDGFVQIIDRLLSKTPSERFGSAVELADALASLSTAPAPRSLANVDRSPSATLTALPAASAPVGASSRTPSRWLAGFATVAAVVMAVLLWQRPDLANLPSGSSAFAPRDTGGLGAPDSATTTPVAVDNAPRDTAIQPPPAPVPLKTPSRAELSASMRSRLMLSAADSALLYVDGALVGRGTAMIERPGAARLTLRAVVADAPVTCVTARADSTVRLAVGERQSVTLMVRDCVGLKFDVEPTDARLRFESLDGGTNVEVRADSTSAVLLPTGRYRFKISAGRCATYDEDSLKVLRTADRAPIYRRVRLDCGSGH